MFDSHIPSFASVRKVERRILTKESQTSRQSWNAASEQDKRDYVAWLRKQGGMFADLALA